MRPAQCYRPDDQCVRLAFVDMLTSVASNIDTSFSCWIMCLIMQETPVACLPVEKCFMPIWVPVKRFYGHLSDHVVVRVFLCSNHCHAAARLPSVPPGNDVARREGVIASAGREPSSKKEDGGHLDRVGPGRKRLLVDANVHTVQEFWRPDCRAKNMSG